MPALTIAHVVALEEIRNRFGPDVAPEKAARLAACAACALTRPRVVLRYHETLLFLAAHPGSRAEAGLVADELARLEAAAPALFESDGAGTLQDSGLAGDTIEAAFSVTLLAWMLETFPGRVEPAWDQGVVGEGLGDLLALALAPPERDGRLDPRFDMQSWVRYAVGEDATEGEQLRWMLDRVRELVPDPEVRDVLAERVELRIRWRLTAAEATRTGTRFPPRPLFVQRTSLKRRFDAARLLRRPLPAPVSLTAAGVGSLIDAGRSVLAVRSREADTVTYANPREVTLFALERGVDVALFGLQPRRRLPLDSYFGYVAARNGVPIAYGGAWVVGRRAEIGVHLFDTFRGGESAFLFGQILRTYRHHYGVHRFQVDPYQFGADNPDAIRSGAFWFYHRFGFRPGDETLAAVAADEWRRIRADRSYRTPAAVLRRFTEAPLVLDFAPADGAASTPDHLDPTRIGLAVTRAIRDRFGADRVAARRWAVRRVARALAVGRRDAWSGDERRAFEDLCPLMAILPGLDAWPVADRRALALVMRSKGGPRERDHVRRFQRHRRLCAALADLQRTTGDP